MKTLGRSHEVLVAAVAPALASSRWVKPDGMVCIGGKALSVRIVDYRLSLELNLIIVDQVTCR